MWRELECGVYCESIGEGRKGETKRQREKVTEREGRKIEPTHQKVWEKMSCPFAENEIACKPLQQWFIMCRSRPFWV